MSSTTTAPKATTHTGSDAASELWNLIHSTPRFSSSQKDRTLYHPLLVQPELRRDQPKHTAVTRRTRIISNDSDKRPDICKSVDAGKLPLNEKIKIAIANGLKSNNGFDDDEMMIPRYASPTSTLDLYAYSEEQRVLKEEEDKTSTATAGKTSAVRGNEMNRRSAEHSFIVCADTQFGMRDLNESWEFELEISRRTVAKINKMRPLPAFVSVCGDLVDMEASFYKDKPKSPFSMDMCHEIQDKQNKDFQAAWGKLDDRVALVCLCGNHDVGNRPTKSSIKRFNHAFGDDYLSFWCNGTFNIVVNTNTFSNPDGAPELLDEQLEWIERELKQARECGAEQIFAFGHHPWFLYNEDEVKDDLTGISPFPKEWGPPPSPDAGFPDHYFHIKRENRRLALNLFREYGVTASFCGHFHQNLCSKTKWGMQHIVTAPLSIYFESTGKPSQEEDNGVGFRLIRVREGHFEHEFVKL